MQAELTKTAIYLRTWTEKIFRDYYDLQKVFFWIAAIITGLVSVGYSWVFDQVKHIYIYVLEANPYYVFALSPLAFVLGWWLIKRFSPEAAGSGIPQVIVASELDYRSNKAFVDSLVSVRAAVVKVLSSLLIVLGGGAIGREGPTLQISAIIFHYFGRISRRFHTESYANSWFVAGAAAGLASAFNTPLGGIVYAIEELGMVQFNRFKSSLLSAVIISGLVAQFFLGSYLFLGFPRLSPYSPAVIPYVIFSAIVTGLLGASFGRLLFWGVQKRAAILSTRRLVALSLSCGVVMASLTVIDQRTAGPGIELISGLLFEDASVDVGLVLGRYFGTFVSYMAGGAGGIFAPSLTIGATIGGLFGKLVADDYMNLMVLLGMIGFLTGVTRTPFTSFVLVLEMTDRHSAIFPMMLAALVSMGAARIVDPKSFYERVKEKYIAEATQSKNSEEPT